MSIIHIPGGDCCGYFTLDAKKLDADGNVISSRRLAGPFPNIITDQGLDRMGNNFSWLGSCQVGAGNATPTATDTGLQTYVAGTNTFVSSVTSVQIAVSPYYASRVNVYRFAAGVAAGNLSEIGIGWNTSGSVLYSRALILDSGGVPTTITVLIDEVLDATYEWRIYPPLVDVTGTVTISGSNYDYTIRAADINQYKTGVGSGWGTPQPFGVSGEAAFFGQAAFSGSIGAITSQPSGTTAGASVSNAAYTPGTLYRDLNHTYGLGVTFPIGAIRFGGGLNMYQIGFSPVIPKNGTNQLTITFRTTWSRRII